MEFTPDAHHLLLLGTRLDLVHGGLLGFLTATMFFTLTFDYYLVRSFFTQKFNLFVFLNRLTYLIVK